MTPPPLSARDRLRFGDDLARVMRERPSPLPQAVLYVLLGLVVAVVGWATFGRLDIVVVAPGKLVPQSFVQVVQPAEAGVVRELLVKEGAVVRTGQVLVRMDARVAEADANTIEHELERKRLQLRRIDAELAGKPFRGRRDGAGEMMDEVEAQLRARRQAYADARGAEEALRQRALHELGAALETEAKLRRTAPIVKEQAQAWAQLARDGYAGRLLALERERLHIDAEQELKAQSRVVESLRATIAQADRRLAQITSNYRQQLHEERAEAAAHYRRLQGESAKHRHRHALLELTAPRAGVVKDLATHTAGAVVAPGAVVLTIVPQNEPLIAEVWIDTADAGFVQVGQRARLKVAAYPFQKYGLIEGRIVELSPDAHERGRAAESAPRGVPDLAYRARIALEPMPPAAIERTLSAGMAVTAEVHTGRRSVLDYLLSPLAKTGAEAGRER